MIYRQSNITRILTIFVLFSACALALGGGGGEKNEGDNTRKMKMTSLDESGNAYGWVRITSDTLSMGCNRLAGDTVFSLYFVNGADKQKLNTEPIRSSAVGETKFSVRLTEPLGAQWAKIVLYQHPDGNVEAVDGLKPVMEASLR